MSKFNKFLEEEKETRSRSNKITEKITTVDYSSLKIKLDTLDKLRKLKLVTKEQSYSTLINEMIEVYITHLSPEEQRNIKMLL
ncbi:hypothetical protein [uncultured Gemella sp.]|uniref:hypothetical protein n=1 Tax=uncultured Gemella sp. TaxID=254352 RepID=UPI0028EEBD2A|nr:hypothetical protein [uncultured Gemella sp.]